MTAHSSRTVSAPWSLTGEQVLAQSQVSAVGLSSAAAAERLQAFGRNELAAQKPVSPLAIFVGQFANLMIGLLAVAALISAAIGEWEDALLIGIIVFVNAVIGFLQEWRAEQAVAALKRLAQPTARAWRDGLLHDVPVAEIVPGDVLELVAGNYVLADARLIEIVDLQVDEAALTGESLPIEKRLDVLPPETALPDRTSMVHSGTAVMLGHGRAVVTATGMQTELGKVADLLQRPENKLTPLQERLEHLSRNLAVLVIGIATLLFAIGLLREPRSEWNGTLLGALLLTAVSLAVAAIPEGLPAVITIALSRGSQRMSSRRAIIRRLAAVETLGSVNVICSDKTGTLTQNRMAVAEQVVADESKSDARRQLLAAAALCNNADLASDGTVSGSATEVAILRASLEASVDVRGIRDEHARRGELPFSSDRKRMTTWHQSPAGQGRVIVKGAAEQVLSLCSSPPGLDRLNDTALQLASRGRRVLAVAERAWSHNALSVEGDDPESQLTLLGLLAIVDPVRPEARDAIQHCRTAGIRTVMITGDHPGTARAISEELALWQTGDEVMTGIELEQMTDDELFERVPRIAVFARVAPEHKLRIVRAHQRHGSVVAMTGDGVNDAPALKQSDIGVAMGKNGTDVARESADMILADDNFATIVAAVEEGRVVYDNIRKFVAFLLTGNLAEVLVLFLAILAGLPMPLLPVHILWINLVTDGLPAVALGFEPAERSVMRRHPRARRASLFEQGLAYRIVGFAVVIAVACLVVFVAATPTDAANIDRARTLVFVALSLAQVFFVLSIRAGQHSAFSVPLLSNPQLIGAVVIATAMQLGVVYVPALAGFFRTVPLTLGDLVIALGVASAGFVIAEITKVMLRSRAHSPSPK